MAPITSTISLNQTGTYILEDDGVPDNFTSRLRRPDGTSVLVVHPTSLLKITASEPGVILKINMTESLEGARLIIGSVSDYTFSPESIIVNQLFGVGSMSLAATNKIIEDGIDAD